MLSAKEKVEKILKEIPDDASVEDIQYHIYVREKVEKGLKDVAEGRVVSHREMEKRAAKWLAK